MSRFLIIGKDSITMRIFGILTFLLLHKPIVSEDLSYTSMLLKPAQIAARRTKINPSVSFYKLTSEFAAVRNSLDFQSNIAHYLSEAVKLSLDNQTVSERCSNDSILFAEALISGEQWTFRVIDAIGKIPVGLMLGNFKIVGSYDECIQIHADLYADPTKKSGYQGKYNGQYCTLPLTDPTTGGGNPEGGMGGQFGLTYDICVPDSCSETDLLIMVNNVLSLIPRSANSSAMEIKSVTCHHPERPMDTGAKVVIGIMCAYGALMLAATLFDILYMQYPRCLSVTTETTLLNDGENYKYKTKSDENSPLLGDKIEPERKEPGTAAKLLLSFSVYSNGKKILDTSQGAGTLTAVNGIRFLSMTWVILGHSVGFGISMTGNILEALPDYLNRWTFQAISNALISVDSFFVLSGLLVGYLTLRELKKNDRKLNWFLFYFHRFWRLTPPYMLLMMVYVPLFPYLYDGPFWSEKGVEPNQCKDSWYFNLLYINNLAGNFSELCMGWTWYLANDMQFFVVSPIFILPLYYSQTIGIVVVMIGILACCITSGVISRMENLPASMIATNPGDPNALLNYFMDYYVKPYCRIGPYLVGMLTGYFLYRTDCRYKMNKIVNLLGWLVATVLSCLILYGLHDEVNGHPLSADVAALYNSTHRTIWGVCLSWVIFTCATGNGGFVNTLLSWTAFVPLSRLTYCGYLIHPIIMYAIYQGLQQTFIMTDTALVTNFLSQLVLAYMMAFVLSLTFESPMMGLEKVLLRRKKRS